MGLNILLPPPLPPQPANRFVRNGVYKLGDLGLARPLSVIDKFVDEGDPCYLPSELLSMAPAVVSLLPAADVFSLGARCGHCSLCIRNVGACVGGNIHARRA